MTVGEVRDHIFRLGLHAGTLEFHSHYKGVEEALQKIQHIDSTAFQELSLQLRTVEFENSRKNLSSRISSFTELVARSNNSSEYQETLQGIQEDLDRCSRANERDGARRVAALQERFSMVLNYQPKDPEVLHLLESVFDLQEEFWAKKDQVSWSMRKEIPEVIGGIREESVPECLRFQQKIADLNARIRKKGGTLLLQELLVRLRMLRVHSSPLGVIEHQLQILEKRDVFRETELERALSSQRLRSVCFLITKISEQIYTVYCYLSVREEPIPGSLEEERTRLQSLQSRMDSLNKTEGVL